MNTGEQPFRNSFGNLVGKNQTIHLWKMKKQEMTFNYLKPSKTMTIRNPGWLQSFKTKLFRIFKTNIKRKFENLERGCWKGGTFKWASENNSLFLKPLHLLIVDRFSSNAGEVLKWKLEGGILGDFAASNLQLKCWVLEESWKRIDVLCNKLFL